MKCLLRLCASVLLAALLCGCQTTPPNIVTAPEATGPVREADILYTTLFDPQTKVELELLMSDDQLQKMQDDYNAYSSQGSKSPIYRMGDLRITLTANGESRIYTIEQVGVRMKGNTSRSEFYNSQYGIYNLIHFKISFQETFDDPRYYGADALQWEASARQERKNRTFASLSKIDLKWNKNYDTTFIKETYAYQFYRSEGVIAPSTTICNLNWCGSNAGLYTLYEPVDKDFLTYWFPEGALGGDLYKLGWSHIGADFLKAESMGVEDEDAGLFYTYDLKTNKTTSNHESLKNLIAVLNKKNLTAEEFSAVVDVPMFLKYVAASYFVGNPDDLRHNYNNTYLYFRADNGKAVFIPYDCDRSFGTTKDWDPSGCGMAVEDPFGDMAIGSTNRQRSPLFTQSVQRGGFLEEALKTVLQEMALSDWLQPEYFAGRYAQTVAMYDAVEDPDERFWNASWLDMSFRLEDTLNIPFATYIAQKMASLQAALNGTEAPKVPSVFYVCSEVTGWDPWENHRMTYNEALGCYEHTILPEDCKRFKLFRRQDKAWFGHECLDEGVQSTVQTDQHTNLILPDGYYLIRFYEKEQRLEIVPQS